MKRFVVAALVIAFAVAGCAHRGADSGWVTLIDGGKGLENFDRIGDANWRAEADAIVADKGKGGHLVSRQSFKDFVLYAEFWADHHTNSGIFMRVSDPKKIGSETSYEVNIYDQRPGQEYATASIVGFAQVPVPIVHRAGGRWNTFEIRAKGADVTVSFNGHVAVHMVNDRFASGPISLQFANGPKNAPGGPIRWRKVQIRPL